MEPFVCSLPDPSKGNDQRLYHFRLAMDDAGNPVLYYSTYHFPQGPLVTSIPIPASPEGYVRVSPELNDGPLDDLSGLTLQRDYHPYSGKVMETLAKCACAVQANYLLHDENLQPLTQEQLGQMANVDCSTVSRLSRGLRLAGSDQRVLFLDELIDSPFPSQSRIGTVSTSLVKKWIIEVINTSEDAVSDERISQILQSKFGIVVARRTVAKYRTEFGIQSSLNGKRTNVVLLNPLELLLFHNNLPPASNVAELDSEMFLKLFSSASASTRLELLRKTMTGGSTKLGGDGVKKTGRLTLPSTKIDLQAQLAKVANNPFLQDRVLSPFEKILDLQDFNASAYERIAQKIETVSKSGDHQSLGILVLGEAGTGKTHLLARLFHRLAHKNHMLFVSNPSNPEGVTSFTWFEIFRSLGQKQPRENTTQADMLLRNGFANILEETLRPGSANAGQNVDFWNCQIDRIRKGEALGDDIETVRNRVVKYWERVSTHPLHRSLVSGLFNYMAYTNEHSRTLLAEWLTNYDAEEVGELGLRPWTLLDEQTKDVDYTAKRENWALKAIEVVSRLAVFGNRPLILAFDQLEALNENRALTRNWGTAVKQIMDEARNLVVVVCVFPSLWKNWFRRSTDSSLAPLDDAVADRIQGTAQPIELQAIDLAVAKRLVEKRLSLCTPALPDSVVGQIFPENVIEKLLYDLADRRSIRRFLKVCQDYFDTARGAVIDAQELNSPESILRQYFNEKNALTDRLEPEDSVIHRGAELVRCFYPRSIEKTQPVVIKERPAVDKRVLPDFICFSLIKDGRSTEYVVGYCNKIGNGLTARLRNWERLMEARPTSRFIIMRSSRARRPGVHTMSHRALEDLRSRGLLLTLGEMHEGFFCGLYGLMKGVLEKELETTERLINLGDLRGFFSSVLTTSLVGELGFSLPVPESVEASAEESPKRSPDHQSAANSAPAPRVEPVSSPLAIEPNFAVEKDEVDQILSELGKFIQEYGLRLKLSDFDPERDVVPAPHLVALHFSLDRGVDVNAIVKNDENASIYLRRHVRIYPNIALGKMTFEVERRTRQPWTLAQALHLMPPAEAREKGVVVPIGVDNSGRIAEMNLVEPPHLLIGGAPGSGKSNYLSCLIASILCRYSADHVRITICDPKQIDFSLFESIGLAHIRKVATTTEEIVEALTGLVEEMGIRYSALRKGGFTSWAQYHSVNPSSPYEVVIVDEVAQLAGADRASLDLIQRLAQTGRAAGIGVVLATQYPVSAILPSQLTVLFNNRVAFKLQNHSQSQVVIDEGGAEGLLGKGDCLGKTTTGVVVRYLTPEFDADFRDWLVKQTKVGV